MDDLHRNDHTMNKQICDTYPQQGPFLYSNARPRPHRCEPPLQSLATG